MAARIRNASGVFTPSASGKKYQVPPATTLPSAYDGMLSRLYHATMSSPVQNSGAGTIRSRATDGDTNAPSLSPPSSIGVERADVETVSGPEHEEGGQDHAEGAAM